MRNFFIVKKEFRKHPEKEIKLPTRATQYSAGYDFYSPVRMIIEPQQSIIVATDIKVYMEGNEFLQIVPRSSIGIKKNLMLKNSMGIIDHDFFQNPDNDGNIHIALFNYGKEIAFIEEGERVAQGIFCTYNIVDDDVPLSVIRKGGIGSSN
jgi:dUTP pyrophosphatase